MKKTIWYISKYFRTKTKNSIGGRSWSLLKEFALRDHQIIVIRSDSNANLDLNKIQSTPKDIFVEKMRIITLRTIKYQIAKSFKRVLSWFHFEWNLICLKKKKLPNPDIIIVSSPSILTILNGIILKKKFECKLVFEVRDIWPLTLVEDGKFSWNNPLIKFLALIERFGYKFSDLIVGTMPKLDVHVKKVMGYSKSVKCIPMGFDPDILNKMEDINHEYIDQFLKPNDFNVIYAGTIGISNALEVFFKAADILKSEAKLNFVVIGDGPLKQEYIKKYSHLKNLIFAPKINKNQVQTALSYASVLFFSVHKSNLFQYGQSLNKVIDYMASKKPIIACYSGYQSMINESNCGYFVPAEDAQKLVDKIRELKNTPYTERNLIGARGLSWLLKNRSYKKLADDYLKFIL